MNLVNEGVLPPNEPDDRDERREEREMAQERETSADIADEIRRAVESMGDEMPYTVSAGTMRRVADRIEAAWKREVAATPKFRLEFDQKALGQEGISVRDILRNLIVSAPETADEEPRVYKTDKVSEEMREFAEDIKRSTDGISPDVASHLCAVIRNFAAKYDMAAEDEASSYQHTIRILNGAVGNAAAMREALVLCSRIIGANGIRGNVFLADIEKAHEAITAALSLPARNCDLYSDAREALKAHEEAFNESNFHHGECKLGCPDCDDYAIRCEIKWLFAPAAERKGECDGR